MTPYRIPDHLKNGFNALNQIDFNKLEPIAAFVREIPVGTGPNKFGEVLIEKFGVGVSEIVEVIYSFGSLPTEEVSISEISSDLAESYFELDIGAKTEQLTKKISLLIDSVESIRIGIKALSLLYENNFNFKDARIVTDLRHVFKNRNLITKEDGGYALCVHQLRVSTSHNKGNRDFFISMDGNDLLELRKQIDRAIEKQNLIENNYSDKIHFIKLTE